MRAAASSKGDSRTEAARFWIQVAGSPTVPILHSPEDTHKPWQPQLPRHGHGLKSHLRSSQPSQEGVSPRIEEVGGSMLWTRAQAQVTEESEDHSLSLPADLPGWPESHRAPGLCQRDRAGELVKKIPYREIPLALPSSSQ